MFLTILQSFTPWIIYFSLEPAAHAAPLALIVNAIFNFKRLKKVFVIEWGTLIYFSILSVCNIVPSLQIAIGSHAYANAKVALASIMWISIFIKNPFSMQYAKEDVPREYWNTYAFKFINYTISAVWALTLSVKSLLAYFLPFSLSSSQWPVKIGLVALWAFPIIFTSWFPEWYVKNYTPKK
ncbi:MAG: hypothetical protein H6679_03110 [Epsilonproteobacteria bacterium]|nr:hypothetical protein [Campylobacterota bacterium]